MSSTVTDLKRYVVKGTVTVSATLEVHAPDEDTARLIAESIVDQIQAEGWERRDAWNIEDPQGTVELLSKDAVELLDDEPFDQDWHDLHPHEQDFIDDPSDHDHGDDEDDEDDVDPGEPVGQE